jgi:hypothetical protein
MAQIIVGVLALVAGLYPLFLLLMEIHQVSRGASSDPIRWRLLAPTLALGGIGLLLILIH